MMVKTVTKNFSLTYSIKKENSSMTEEEFHFFSFKVNVFHKII